MPCGARQCIALHGDATQGFAQQELNMASQRFATEGGEGWVKDGNEWVFRDGDLSLRCAFSHVTGHWGFGFYRLGKVVRNFPDVASEAIGCKIMAGWWYDGYVAGREKL